MEEITAHAGFSRGAFYSNFSSKEEIVTELLQRVVYDEYRSMADRMPARAAGTERLRWIARELMLRQKREEADPWIWQLWLELLAHVTRHPEFRGLAAGFWRATRDLTATAIASAYVEAGEEPPASPERIAAAMIALDVGLALQHFVDPDGVPLDVYPDLYELLFRPFAPGTVPGDA